MNDERFLRDWLRHTTDSSADAATAADEVVARLPDIPQRRRRLPWLPTLRRFDHDEPRGRTRAMFSPLQAISAGTLALALGGVLLIIQPFAQSQPRLGAEGLAPILVDVTGTAVSGACEEAQITTAEDFRRTSRSCHPMWEFDDPRLNGSVTLTTDLYSYLVGETVHVDSWAFLIQNDGGAWRMRPVFNAGFGGPPDPLWPQTWVFDGEGGYEGLTAVFVADDYQPHGYIIDGAVPQAAQVGPMGQ